MNALFGGSWKTTASGCIVALFVFLEGSGLNVPGWVTKTMNGLEAVAIVCLGVSAKDFNANGDKK